MTRNRPIAGTLQAYRMAMANTEIVNVTRNDSPIALARVCRPAAPVEGIARMIAETLSDLAYDATRALCYDTTIERAAAGDAFSARYLLVMDPAGDDATGRLDVSDDEIGALLASFGE